jgi:predicted enzyme related to lactoylglutathione lyase
MPENDPLVALSLEASLTVGDLPASVGWYTDVLGFAVEREYRREERLFAVAIRAGAVELLLGQDDGTRGGDRVKGAGISLQITTTQDIHEIASRIRAHGGVIESGPFEIQGKRAFRLRDPNGFGLTISSPRVT